MIALGVLGSPPNSYQPALVRGMYLRWGFLPELGFPWHGFYLFRRPARPGRPLCLRSVIGGLKKGHWDQSKHYTALGVISSDTDLVLTDDFTPPNQVEFALDGRNNLRFDFRDGELARHVELQIGFRQERCLDLEKLIPGDARPPDERARATAPMLNTVGPNPLVSPGVSFAVKNFDGTLGSRTHFARIETPNGLLVGLKCGYGLTIELQAASETVDLLLTITEAGPAPRAASGTSIEAFDGKNKKVATASVVGPPNQPQTITLAGKKIVRIEILTFRDIALLHRICADELNPEIKAEVTVTAFSGVTPIRSIVVSGKPGKIASAIIESDAISAIEIGPCPGSLVDLCYVPVAQDATLGWEKLPPPRGIMGPVLTYPIGLPVTHPDYPCSVPDPRGLLPNRVRYKLPPGWERLPPDFDPPNFVTLRAQLTALVKDGPAGGPMADRIFKAPPESSSPPDPDPPNLGRFFVLDLILLGALHPGLAQLLGLYWVDQTAQEKVAYDYLIVADHTGVGQRDPDKVLAVIQSDGFAQLDGYIVFNRQLEKVSPLPAPLGLKTFELAGGTFPDAEGQLPKASNNAGLVWELGEDDPDGLLPDSAVMYLVWRTYLGNAAKPSKGLQVLVTKSLPDDPKPLVVTKAQLPRGLKPERSPDWPEDQPLFIDPNLPDGFYRYEVSGINLFGLHTLNSAPSQVLLRDKIPPPPPTAVEAYTLDPEDSYLRKDDAYKNWRGSLDATVRETLVGLRVGWIWTKDHQKQAPDAREFRVYFHPGSDLPPAHDLAQNWQERFHVVPYDQHFASINPTNREFPASGGIDFVTIVAASGVKWGAVSSDPSWITISSGSSGNGSGACTYSVASNPGTPRTGTIKIAGHTFIINQQSVSSTPLVSTPAGAPEDRAYEVFLPLASATTPVGLPLNPSLAKPVVYAHIGVSAADDKPHTSDQRTSGNWSNRPGNEGRVGPTARIYRVWRTPPPPPEDVHSGNRYWASSADYHSRSFFTYRWKPQEHLKLHVFRAMDDGVFKADWSQRPSTTPLSKSDLKIFPADWNQATRQHVADELNVLNTFVPFQDRTAEAMAYYRQLSDGALRVLAGLSSAESAYFQLTINPLDPDDADNANRLGPDNPDSAGLILLDPDQRAFIDTLDGSATNRYFYRAAFVDGAHNLGPLGLSSPPVYLPNVVPPRAPVITKILGGDRQITIKWASNREPDLAEYRVYRTDKEEATRDVRLMTLLDTLTIEPTPDPADRPAEVTWTDAPVPGLVTFYYRLAAVDDAGNASVPSRVVVGRAFDDSRPHPPTWNPPATGVTSNEVLLSWTSTLTDLRCLLQRRSVDATAWENLSWWLECGLYSYEDSNRISGESFVYRLLVMDAAGTSNNTFNELTV